MEKRYWTITEVLETLQIKKEFLDDLEREELICSTYVEAENARVFDLDEVVKIRVIKTMVEDLGVNLPGVEVILHMRQEMVKMRKQLDRILEHVAREVKKDLKQLMED